MPAAGVICMCKRMRRLVNGRRYAYAVGCWPRRFADTPVVAHCMCMRRALLCWCKVEAVSRSRFALSWHLRICRSVRGGRADGTTKRAVRRAGSLNRAPRYTASLRNSMIKSFFLRPCGTTKDG